MKRLQSLPIVAALWTAVACSPQGATAPADAAAADAAASDGAGDAVAGPQCRAYQPGQALGALKTDKLNEISGIAESRRNIGVLWLHNDAGDAPRLFAVGLAGNLLAEIGVPGAKAEDWEDIAVGPGALPGQSYLYIADIGDNDGVRDRVRVYRAAEPAIDPGKPGSSASLDPIETFEFRYPDGPRDAETLMVDPLGGDLLVVSKESDGKSKLYRAKAPLQAGAVVELVKAGKLEFGKALLPGDPLATAGDISADGLHFAIRTRDHAFEWTRLPSESVPQALFAAPCVLPLRSEDQGEAIAYAADGSGFYTVSEGKGSKILFYQTP